LGFLVMIFLLLHYDLHQERRTDPRSGTNNGFSSENRSTVNQVLSFFPTPNPVSCFFLQLATWNFQLMLFLANGEPFNGQPVSLCSFLPLHHQPRFLRIAQRVDRSVHRTPRPYTLYPIPAITHAKLFSITVYVSRGHPSLKREPVISLMDFQMRILARVCQDIMDKVRCV
jgi:hypothetical protein